MTNLFLRILQKGRRGVCRSRGFPAAAVHNPTQGTEMALRRTLGSGDHPPCLPCRTGKYSQSDAAGSLNRRIPCGHIVRAGKHAQRNRSGDGKSACRRTHRYIPCLHASTVSASRECLRIYSSPHCACAVLSGKRCVCGTMCISVPGSHLHSSPGSYTRAFICGIYRTMCRIFSHTNGRTSVGSIPCGKLSDLRSSPFTGSTRLYGSGTICSAAT